MAKYKNEYYEQVWDNTFSTRSNQTDWFGKTIEFNSYGEEDGYGWEIDHIWPKAEGGSDSLKNYQPLHSKNNNSKADLLEGEVNGKKFEVIKVDTLDSKTIGKMVSK